MNKLKYLVFFFAFFFACQEKEKKEKPINYIEHSIKRSLLDGYYAKVNKNIGVSIYHNNIFIFSTNKNGFSLFSYILLNSEGICMPQGPEIGVASTKAFTTLVLPMQIN